jgi:hypothetical protein
MECLLYVFIDLESLSSGLITILYSYKMACKQQQLSSRDAFLFYIAVPIIAFGWYISLALIASLPGGPCERKDRMLECMVKIGTIRLLILAGIALGVCSVFYAGSLIWNRCRRG